MAEGLDWGAVKAFVEKKCRDRALEPLKSSSDHSSLCAMTEALDIACGRLEVDQLAHPGVISALRELHSALKMATHGEVHASLRIRKNRSQRRGRSPMQRQFLLSCLNCSDGLVLAGLTVAAADKQVIQWGRKKAKRLKIKLEHDGALRELRKPSRGLGPRMAPYAVGPGHQIFVSELIAQTRGEIQDPD